MRVHPMWRSGRKLDSSPFCRLIRHGEVLRNWTHPLFVVFCVLGTSAWSWAATLTYSIVPTNDPGSSQVVVEPGAEVPYTLTARITYEGTQADNAGLAFFSIDVRTDLLVAQLPIDSFDPQIALTFPVLQTRGTPREGPVAGVVQDILQISGSQDTFAGTQTVLEVALLQTQVLGQGRLLAPQTEGTFTAGILDTSTANVFRPTNNSVFQPEIAFGPPITIITRAADDGSDDDDDDTDDDTDDDDTEDETAPVTESLPGAATLTLFAVLVGLLGLALWGGPLLLFLAPILVIILIVMLGLGQW